MQVADTLLKKQGVVYMERKYLYLACLFVTCLLVSNIIASKIVDVWGFLVPAAVFVFPVTFLITDTINEVWGKKKAREIILIGFIMNIVLLLFIQLGRVLPPAPFYEYQEAYEAVLGAVPRVVAASLAAYIISQLHDVWAFNFWRKVTSGKHLWLRNNLSTITSQLLDSVVFISLAFLGQFKYEEILILIFYQFLVKISLAIIDTPFCYLMVKWVRGKEVVTIE